MGIKTLFGHAVDTLSRMKVPVPLPVGEQTTYETRGCGWLVPDSDDQDHEKATTVPTASPRSPDLDVKNEDDVISDRDIFEATPSPALSAIETDESFEIVREEDAEGQELLILDRIASKEDAQGTQL